MLSVRCKPYSLTKVPGCSQPGNVPPPFPKKSGLSEEDAEVGGGDTDILGVGGTKNLKIGFRVRVALGNLPPLNPSRKLRVGILVRTTLDLGNVPFSQIFGSFFGMKQLWPTVLSFPADSQHIWEILLHVCHSVLL